MTVNGETTRHVYNGQNVIYEEVNGTAKAAYHRLGDRILASRVYNRSVSNRYYYVYNGQGNITTILNGSSNTAVDYDYDAFGYKSATNEDVYNPFRYNGEYLDNETGYTYLRNRYYDSDNGRFINEDPIRSGLNWYSYCRGNPVMCVDPMGLYYCDRDTSPEQLEEYRRKNSVVVHEGEEAIDIYLNIYMHGNMADEIAGDNITYKEATKQGIIAGWQGEYDYKTVNVIINDLSGALHGRAEEQMLQDQSHHTVNGYNVITIGIMSGMLWDPEQDAFTGGEAWFVSGNKVRPNRIDLYTGGDGYAPVSMQYFLNSAGHEIGHELGLYDFYKDRRMSKYNMPSIMRDPDAVNGAQQIDYYLMMQAQQTNMPQWYSDAFYTITGKGLSWFGYKR